MGRWYSGCVIVYAWTDSWAVGWQITHIIIHTPIGNYTTDSSPIAAKTPGMGPMGVRDKGAGSSGFLATKYFDSILNNLFKKICCCSADFSILKDFVVIKKKGQLK